MGISSVGIKFIGNDIELNRARHRDVCDTLKIRSLQIDSEPQIDVLVTWLEPQTTHGSSPSPSPVHRGGKHCLLASDGYSYSPAVTQEQKERPL